MLILYDSSGRPAYPLDVPAESFYIKHEYGGNETLELDISPRHKLYRFIAEEIQIGWDDNIYLIKTINERKSVSTITCQLDVDFLKNRVYQDYRNEECLLLDILRKHLPEGWTADGAELVTARKTIELETATDYEIIMQAMETYGVVYEWHMANRTVRILKPENEQPSGEFLSEELNLKSVAFKGNSNGIVTRLYPYGKDGLSISTVNQGCEYIENHAYSDKVISAVWKDDQYTDPQTLKDNAIEYLKKLAWPMRSYECEVTDLAKQLSDYDFMDFKLYKIVTLLDKVRKTRVDHRIVEYQEYPYAPHLNVVTLSSVAEKITTKIEKIEVKFNDEVKVDRKKINEIRRDVDTNSARIAETYTRGETDTRIESLVQQSADSITTTVRQEISTAVDRVQIGGRNLLLKSDVPVATTAYIMHDYYFGAEKPVAGETYTISLKGALHKDKLYFGVFNSGDTIGVCYPATPDADGVYRKTFQWIDKIDNAVADNTFVRIYAMPSRVTGVESSLEWVKLEKGNKSTDWTPAPEDVDDSINTAVDGIQVGGRNLLLNSTLTDNTNGWKRGGTGHSQTVKYGKKCWHFTGAMEEITNVYQDVLSRVEPNTTYTFSGWTLTENISRGTTDFKIMLYMAGYYDNNGTSTWFGPVQKSFTINPSTGNWTYLSHTFTTDDKINTATSLNAFVHSKDYTGDVYFYNLKLEKGNKATDWSPAPEDVDSKIDAVQTRVTTTETQITQNAEAISQRATKTEMQTVKASADAANSKIEGLQIGGRNLLLNSSFADNMDGWFYNGALGNQTTKYGKKCWHITGGVGRDTHVYQKSVLTRVEANTTYTLSGWALTENIVKGPTNYVAMLYTSGRYNNNGADTWFGYGGKSFAVNTGTGKWEYLSHTFTTDDKIEKATSFFIYVFTRDYTGDIYFYNLKLEKGNKATDWTPAPEDVRADIDTAVDNVQIGGRNLLLKSGVPVTTADYHVNSYYFGSTKPVAGETYTLSLKGTLHAEKSSLRVFNSGGSVALCSFTKEYLDKDGVYRATFPWKITQGSVTVDNSHIQIYAIPSSVTGVESSIDWIKLEKGNKATDWTPAPEDQEAALNQAITKVETQQSEILQKSNEITLQALSSYITKTRLEEFEQEVSARLAVQSENITASFNQANTYTVEVDGRLQEFLEEFSTYIRMSASGIELGDNNSPFGALLGTTKLSFTQDGREIAYISNNRLYITDAEISNSLTVGSTIKYKTYVDSNGYLVTQRG